MHQNPLRLVRQACQDLLGEEVVDRAGRPAERCDEPGDLLRLADSDRRRYQLEPEDGTTPEILFERRWALTLLDRTLARLAEGERGASADRAGPPSEIVSATAGQVLAALSVRYLFFSD